MIIDGRLVAKKVEDELRESFEKLRLPRKPKVSFLTFGDDPATKSFLKIKAKVAERIGVELQVHELPEDVLEDVAKSILSSLVLSADNDGVVVQLPLPEGFKRNEFLEIIPADKDVDCLSESSMEAYAQGKGIYAPPVALAVAEILESEKIDLSKNRIAVVGHGNLVGKPVASWLQRVGAEFEVFDIGSDLFQLARFDIVISGVGEPGLIREEMIKEGVILIDAGTSEVGGKLFGDASIEAQEKSSLRTPVPGGIGPVTVVKLFENLLTSVRRKNDYTD